MARTRTRTSSRTGISPRAFPGPGSSVGEQVTLPDGRIMQWDGAEWIDVTPGGGGGLTDPTTTLGDLLVRGTSAVTRLGVGTNDQVLTADSTAALHVAWKAAAGGARYVHNATTAATTWIVPHNLNEQYVAVQIVSPTGDTMLADVDFVSTIRCDLIFSRAVAGTAVIRR